MFLFLTSDSDRHDGVQRKAGANDFSRRTSLYLSGSGYAQSGRSNDVRMAKWTRGPLQHGLEGSTVTMRTPMAEGNERGRL